MKKIKLNELKKLARMIYFLKKHNINPQDVRFLGSGCDLLLIETELKKKGIEIK